MSYNDTGIDDNDEDYTSQTDRVSRHKTYSSRESEHDRSRTRGRGKDHDRYRGGYKDGSVRNDGRRDKFGDFDRHERSSRGRNFHRHRDYDGDRGRRNGNRSGSYSQGRFQNRSRSRSRSRSPSKSKRKSGFDMAPSEVGMLPGAAVAVNDAGQLPSLPQTMPGVVQNALQFGTTQFGVFPLMPAQAMTQQATRHARRVYVGGLPPLANEQTIAAFFSHIMASIGGNAAGPGDAVVNVYINHEKKFAFVEMRTVEEASNAMALDGIIFEAKIIFSLFLVTFSKGGVAVRVRRPTDYNPSLAATLGPSQPSPLLNLAAVGLVPGTISGAEGPDRVFVGGLPYYFTELQIRELLESFGPLRGFDLVKDRDTGNSKGYGFCVYQDPAVTDIACAALNGLKMGDKTLTVRRATESGGQSKSEQENILAQAQQHIAIQKMALQAGVMNLPGVGIPLAESAYTPSKVLCLTEAITMEVLADDEEYEEILEDMREECCKFGTLINVVIPRPSQDEEKMPGAGKVFLEYSDTISCANARNALNGRKFGGNTVNAFYYPEEKYSNGDYGA
ncbi:splicing factor U2af large subunit A-like [Populus alba x Populus x berolinensis]|uniref:Splicing factor U2af large subunit n=1 Tax=Populus alba x Populus x berolinensis TaxID=444605 RepID=A0AAD6QZX2_9ROSI|nr:splicing factor U2af large subunit A-like [Populus alba x Populus x berolinensis]